ncbi:MAG: SRPBCC family protein [Devosia sp.]
MLQARTVTVLINRPIEDVYDFLVEPANLARWTTVGPGQAEPEQGPLVWSFLGPQGLVRVRFTPPNRFYVLDYTLQSGPHVWQSSSVRLIRNGNGCVLTHTSVQQPLVADDVFASEQEWLGSDLLVLKSLLEVQGQGRAQAGITVGRQG